MTKRSVADTWRLVASLWALVAALLIGVSPEAIARVQCALAASAADRAAPPAFRDAVPEGHARLAVWQSAVVENDDDDDDDDDEGLPSVLLPSAPLTFELRLAASRAPIDPARPTTPSARFETHRAARGPPRCTA